MEPPVAKLVKLLFTFQLFKSLHSAITGYEFSCDPWDGDNGGGERGPNFVFRSDHFDCITDGPINCQASRDCFIYCEENIQNVKNWNPSMTNALSVMNESCAGITINCPDNAACIIDCRYSCNGMTVNAQTSTYLDIDNCATKANGCDDMTIWCPQPTAINNPQEVCSIFGDTTNTIHGLNIHTQQSFSEFSFTTSNIIGNNTMHCGLTTTEHSCLIDTIAQSQCQGSTGACQDYIFTASPTQSPTPNPSNNPTITPTNNPTRTATLPPSFNPSTAPIIPTFPPTGNPTIEPTIPTIPPTIHPTITTYTPSIPPTNTPTSPTLIPTNNPSKNPTKYPSNFPTLSPTNNPSKYPSNFPTFIKEQQIIVPITTDIIIETEHIINKASDNNDYVNILIIVMVIICFLVCVAILLYYLYKKRMLIFGKDVPVNLENIEQDKHVEENMTTPGGDILQMDSYDEIPGAPRTFVEMQPGASENIVKIGTGEPEIAEGNNNETKNNNETSGRWYSPEVIDKKQEEDDIYSDEMIGVEPIIKKEDKWKYAYVLDKTPQHEQSIHNDNNNKESVTTGNDSTQITNGNADGDSNEHNST